MTIDRGRQSSSIEKELPPAATNNFVLAPLDRVLLFNATCTELSPYAPPIVLRALHFIYARFLRPLKPHNSTVRTAELRATAGMSAQKVTEARCLKQSEAALKPFQFYVEDTCASEGDPSLIGAVDVSPTCGCTRICLTSNREPLAM